jgi:hypothetical protein
MSTRTRPERKGYDVIIYQQHVDRLKKIAPTVDAGPPREHPLSNRGEMEKVIVFFSFQGRACFNSFYIHYFPCFCCLQRRRFLVIEFENKLLLERLAKVVQNKSIDNEIHKSVDFHIGFKKKLAVAHRKVEMQKLTVENQAMLKRIQEVPPAYNHLEWEEDAKYKDHIKRCMALYPEYYERLDKEKAEKAQKKTASKSPGGTTKSFGVTK